MSGAHEGPDQPTGPDRDEPADQSGDRPADESGEQVGSVAEEAMKLFGALSDAARDHDLAAGLSGLAGHAARAAEEVDQHLATGAEECTWCPLCRTVHAVRRTSPEVRAHLASAASSLLQAAAGMLATAVPDPDPAAGRGSRVERIDLDEDDEDWPEDDR